MGNEPKSALGKVFREACQMSKSKLGLVNQILAQLNRGTNPGWESTQIMERLLRDLAAPNAHLDRESIRLIKVEHPAILKIGSHYTRMDQLPDFLKGALILPIKWGIRDMSGCRLLIDCSDYVEKRLRRFFNAELYFLQPETQAISIGNRPSRSEWHLVSYDPPSKCFWLDPVARKRVNGVLNVFDVEGVSLSSSSFQKVALARELGEYTPFPKS